MINTRGTCFAEFFPQLDDTLIESIHAVPFSFLTSSEETVLLQLADVVSVNMDPALFCGELGFRLVESMPFLDVTPEGVVTILAQTDDTWVG